MMIEQRLVTVEEVNHPYAVVRDQRGATFEVPTSILPVRGKVPRAGEQWLVTRDFLPGWHWVGYVDVTGQGGSSYREVIGDGVTEEFTITHGLGTLAVHVQVHRLVGGKWEIHPDPVGQLPTIILQNETQVEITFAQAPAQDAAAVVVLSV